MADDDRDLLLDTLRAVLRTPGSSAKLAAAKVQAARQLAGLQGLALPAGGETHPDVIEVPDDPNDEVAAKRRQLPATGVR